MKANVYIIVFGIVVAIIVIAALVSQPQPMPNRGVSTENISQLNLPNLGLAPNLQGIAGWINTVPLNISGLRGNVVLVDFWTYSCINCIRSIPHLNAWYSAYGDNGLVIIGVSTPEFQFEHNYGNVYSAVQRFGIKYPVALDNNYSTWDAYNNHYWPADYVVDSKGYIRYETFGEGDYNQTEEVIRGLLLSAGYTVQPNLTSVPLGVNFSGIGTPEIYFGYSEILDHGSHFSEEDSGIMSGAAGSTAYYPRPNVTQYNTVYLQGYWYNAPDSIVAVNGSRIFLIYKAEKVNVVASGNGGNSSIVVNLDGGNLTEQYLGSDDRLSGGEAIANIGPSRLYNIVSAPNYAWHTLEIDAGPGFKPYTFTLG